MKQGKVFIKLIARKNVQGITFQDKTCTVTLTNGLTKVCNTAHEARLFIEGKDVTNVTQTTPKAVKEFEAAFTRVEAPTAKCGTQADEKIVTVSRDWLIEHAGEDFGVTGDYARITIPAMAAIIAGGVASY